MSSKANIAYYRVDLKLESALSIGSAESVLTDVDVVLDSRGLPLIPATSLAGVYRSFFAEADARDFFGKLVEDGGELTQSVVRVYDASWMPTIAGEVSNQSVSIRDNVSLGEVNKVAKTGLKFDRQVVERGALFRTYIEVSDCTLRSQDGVSICECLEQMLSALNEGSLALGAKTTRGLGKVSVRSCLLRSFDLADPGQMDAWLDFHLFDGAAWSGEVAGAVSLQRHAGNDLVLALDLTQRGAASIREYATAPGRPDFEQLHIRDTREGMGTIREIEVPVIPGSSWAGAFRNRYRTIAGEKATRWLFGDVWQEGGKTVTRMSRIEFSETELTGGGWKEITRNSIDRFTGGTKDGALFKLRTYYGGRARLEIRIRCKDDELSDELLAPLLACIADLHNGLLAVGGLTAVGHGMFRIDNATCAVGGIPLTGFDCKAGILGTGEFAEPDMAGIARLLVRAVNDQREGEASHE